MCSSTVASSKAATISVGEAGEISVDVLRRRDIMRNHTATHLLHRALRDVLGEHAEQAGSLVAPERLRFDFGHPQSVTAAELHEIERRVNAWVRADTEVSPAEMSRAAAEQLGATALFGEKYGDVVRVVTVGCANGNEPSSDGEDCTHIHARPSFCSRELCGGTHVDRTGEIGYFRILGESSVGSGLRRIEATTGRGAEEYVETQLAQLRELSGRLGVGVNQIGDRLNQLLAQVRQQQAEIAQLQRGQSAATLEQLIEQQQTVGDVAYVAARVDASSVDALRELGDRIRDKLRSGIVVLGTVVAEKPQIIAMVTPDLVSRGYHAGKLVKSLAAVVGGGGGGRPDVAQAGGRDSAKLEEALAQVPSLLQQQVG